MTRHLLTETLPRLVADLARYYAVGGTLPERGTAGWPQGEGGPAAEAGPGHEGGAPAGPSVKAADPAGGEFRRDMHPLVAKALRIDPEAAPTPRQISALLAGRRADGDAIEGKHYAELRRYTDPKTGELREKIPLGSVDFTLTPDKSVSLAWAFAVPAEQAMIYQAHRDAAHRTLAYMERQIGRAARGKGGRDGHDPGHVGWIAFDHFTARPTLWLASDAGGEPRSEAVPVPVAADPDLHTHFTVFNAVFCENGRVGSLDLDQLNGLVKEGGALYQAHLATFLRERLGAAVSLDPATGMARLDAIPEQVRLHFSKRSLSGEAAARAYAAGEGLDWDGLSPERRIGLLKAGTQGMATGLDGPTRAKLRKDGLADVADWRRQAATLGWQHHTIGGSRPVPSLAPEKRLRLAYRAALPWLERELDCHAVLHASDARIAALRGLIAHGIEGADDVHAVTELMRRRGVRQQGRLTRLVWGAAGETRHVRLTTTLHAGQEREFLTLAVAAGRNRRGALSRSAVRRAVRASGLSFEGDHGRAQLAAIYRLGSTGGALSVLIGAAGMGKTTALKPLVAEWTRQGRQIWGISLAWRQADELAQTGIPVSQVKAISVFLEAERAGALPLTPGAVVVVDELSLLGTRQGLELLRLQAKHGFRMVWLGDDRQCQSIEAGPIIELARRALGRAQVPDILTTVRQQTEREREIVGLFRQGQAARALAMKREDRTAELVPGGYQETASRVAQLMSERLRANAHDPGYSLSLSTPTNADAHRLGLAIREERRRLGQIGRDAVVVEAVGQAGETYALRLAPGDRIRLFASARAQGMKGSIGRNGTILTVLDADLAGLHVRNGAGSEGRITWNSLSDGAGRARLAYGEVMTTHTAQGVTSTEHIYVLPAGTHGVNGYAAYVSGTRHRRTAYFVASEGAERSEVARRRPINDVRPIDQEDAWNNVARNLSRRPTQELALDFLAQAGKVRQAAAWALPEGLRRLELRARAGEIPSVLRHAFERQREAAALAPFVAMLERTAARQQAVVRKLHTLGPAVAQAVATRLSPRVSDHGRAPRIGL